MKIRNQRTGNECAIYKDGSKGVVIPLLLGLFFMFVVLPVSAWKDGQEKEYNSYKRRK